MLFLHGIFGSGANWRTFARRFVAARPQWGAVLVDLPQHGGSQGRPPPHTVAAAAADLLTLEAHLHTEVAGEVEAVVGHSFGGKVALAYAAAREAPLRRAWILDATPGPREDAHGSEIIPRVFRALEKVAGTRVLATREEFLAGLVAEGIDPGLGPWLAMNVRPNPDGEGYRLRLDLPSLKALLDDYFRLDLWPVVESPRPGLAIDLVLGGRSGVFDDADKARVRAAAQANPAVRVHVLPQAGHWVHVDDPDGLFRVLTDADSAP